jgi:hypothetical protein
MPFAAPIDLLNHILRMNGGHQYAWDFIALSEALKQAGFSSVSRFGCGSASCSELCLDNPDHAFESLYVEANKPETVAVSV